MPRPAPRAWTPPEWRVRILVCIILALLQTLDAVATLRFVALGARELNPAARMLMGVSPIYFVLLKSIGVSILALCAAYGTGAPGVRTAWQRGFWRMLCAMTVLYSILAVAHLYFLWCA